MDADEPFEKLALVRTGPLQSRDYLTRQFMGLAKVHNTGRFYKHTHMMSSSMVRKKEYSMKIPQHKLRFGTAKNRDDWIDQENKRRVVVHGNSGVALNVARCSWNHVSYSMLMGFLGKYGAIRANVRVKKRDGCPEVRAVLKPIPCVDYHFKPLIGGVSVSPIFDDTPERIALPIPDRMCGASVPIVNEMPETFEFKSSQAETFRFHMQRVWKCKVRWGDMAERLYLKENLCLLARSEEADGVAIDVWVLIATYARSPPYLVELDAYGSIILPEQADALPVDRGDSFMTMLPPDRWGAFMAATGRVST